MIESIIATCIYIAAQTYAIPPVVLMGIFQVEGGRVGQQVKNTNNTYDLGPMQINTIWLPELAKHWKVRKKTAWKWVRDDACTNVNVAAWILKKNISRTGSLYKGIGYYHSGTPRFGHPYRRKVLKAMEGYGLLKLDTGLRRRPVISVKR